MIVPGCFTFASQLIGVYSMKNTRCPTPRWRLLEQLGSNMCSKFHENSGILKPILLNCDMGGVSYLNVHDTTQ